MKLYLALYMQQGQNNLRGEHDTLLQQQLDSLWRELT